VELQSDEQLLPLAGREHRASCEMRRAELGRCLDTELRKWPRKRRMVDSPKKVEAHIGGTKEPLIVLRGPTR